jgi:coenzyme PQQ precursor peptide PqqA
MTHVTTAPQAPSGPAQLFWRLHMAWQKPQATDLRYGFEITMYISNR